jgi:Susd and RagB outer membrane lipoprotein
MKLETIKKITIATLLGIAMGCTDNFENINTNPNGFTNAQIQQDFNDIRGQFPSLFNGIYNNLHWKYQLQQNLNADLWSGYMATPTPFRGGSNNSTYDLVDGWNGFVWDLAYQNAMASALKVEQRAKGKYNQFYAWSLILKVEAMHRVTDVFGPIVYSKYGTEETTIPYDSQEEAYKKMFEELDIAVADLTARSNANEPSTFGETDISGYGGKYELWVKFANSLRLRLAMRVVKINPILAKTEAEKAMGHPLGVIGTKDEMAYMKVADPISTISESWADIRMGADMESIMVGYQDPRLAVYFKESVDFPGQYRGIRTGINIVAKSDRTGMSRIGAVVAGNAKVLMSPAEVYFLRAEGALRGWNMGGTSQNLYEDGIKASFDQYGIGGATTYLADNTKMANNFIDVKEVLNNVSSINNITIAWNTAATNEVKLQKIITQKWIAMFPDGQEAWSEHRRTGYPKLFPVVKNTSGGVIDSNLGVRRINFTQSEKDGNPGGYQTGLAKLGGIDNGATRLWWDTTGPNF